MTVELSVVDLGAPDPDAVDRLLAGTHANPHQVLGAHPRPAGAVVRALQPGAAEVTVVTSAGERFGLGRLRDGLFSGVVPVRLADYRFEVVSADRIELVDDPYRWLPTVGELDLYLIGEGRHERLWEVLGAHPRSLGGVSGTAFAVWAPHASGVQVFGLPMRRLDAGVWELFVPGVAAGAEYRFRVLGADGVWREKADPMAFAARLPESVVHTSVHEWGDDSWLAARSATDWSRAPVSVYEVHLGSWRPGLGYRELAVELADYVTELGFTHVELLPVAEHPYGGSWGYQVTSYYAPTSRFGSPDDFRYFVDALHQRGIGVIVDWVPAHFPRDEWALARFDGTALYEHPDPRRGEHPDWGTYVFDFGRPEVRNFLVANALYWVEEFHVDGLRVDAVASMLYLDYSRPEGAWEPNVHGGRENLEAVRFLQELNATVYKHHPGVVMIAEESTTWPGVTRPTDHDGLGFGFKWNMGWMHDDLRFFGLEPVDRGPRQDEITFSLSYAWSENFVLPLSHDEVVHGKGSLWRRMPGDDWNKAASLRSLFAFMWAHPGKQLLFMGGEFGQREEWSEFGLDWHLLDAPAHSGVRRLVADLNRVYRSTPALHSRDTSPDGFTWVHGSDLVFAFLRHGESQGDVVACVANFAGVPRPDYRIGLPKAGRWREAVNTDGGDYGGSGVGNLGEVVAEEVPYQGQPASAVLTLPPMGVLWLMPDTYTDV
ncbi:1,4-alpha-glucan branching enzyme [Saccharothrix sp. ALI-22-I]|uniref:1,4-alpha-glucan branching protein GlgB n=1 Tax=Saccharothrix sp. ALI-22-I TaxID=1933778 RepID=UPI00097CAA3E|nr:1,4-alpha-glucan branching protein GlgB [Saccharothrix sp. ALI-22-I]ONI85468.1 1,4-alpha-glucan branching enzyme [Saccharothrix sp. ALI-22-I]